jgi:hypothetical protein
MGNRTFLVAQTLAESLNGIVNLVVLLGGVHARKTRAASASTVGLRTRARSTALATGLLPALLVPRLPAGLPLVLGNAGVVVVVGLGLVGAVLVARGARTAATLARGATLAFVLERLLSLAGAVLVVVVLVAVVVVVVFVGRVRVAASVTATGAVAAGGTAANGVDETRITAEKASYGEAL